MVLSFESFAANIAHVLPFVAVCQFVFGQCRRVPEHFPAGLKHTHLQCPIIQSSLYYVHNSCQVYYLGTRAVQQSNRIYNNVPFSNDYNRSFFKQSSTSTVPVYRTVVHCSVVSDENARCNINTNSTDPSAVIKVSFIFSSVYTL